MIQMTRAQYEAKYGVKPNVPPKPVTPIISETSQESNPSFMERAGTDIKKSGENVYNAIQGEGKYAGESPIRRGFEATAAAFHTPIQVGYEALPGLARTGLKKFGEVIGGAINKGVEKISDIPQLQEWTMRHPEAVKNLEEILGTTTAAGSIAGDILTEQAAATAAQKTLNKGLEIGGKVAKKGGELLETAGKKLNRSAYSLTEDEARLVQANKSKIRFLEDELDKVPEGSTEYNSLSKQLDEVKANSPITRPDTALEHGISGTEKQIGVQSGAEKLSLWKDKIEPALKGAKETISKDELFAKAEERIANELEPGRKTALQNALDSVKEDYADIDKLNLADANKIKSGLDKFTPTKIFKGQDVASELKTIKADMADAIREKTYNALADTDIKGAYRDYANLKQLEKVGIKALTESGKKGGFGNFWSTIKDQLTVPIKTVGGKVLYNVGNKLQFIGDKGITTLGEHLNNIGFDVSSLNDIPNKEGGFIRFGSKPPTIMAGGKEWSLDQIHNTPASEFTKLPLADQKLIANFDSTQSLKLMLENAKQAGRSQIEISTIQDALSKADASIKPNIH